MKTFEDFNVDDYGDFDVRNTAKRMFPELMHRYTSTYTQCIWISGLEETQMSQCLKTAGTFQHDVGLCFKSLKTHTDFGALSPNQDTCPTDSRQFNLF